MLIKFLILFFTILIIFQILSQMRYNFNYYIIEGMTATPEPQQSQQYQPYDTNNPNNALILAQQNAGNIQVLKQQLDKALGLEKEVRDMSGNLATLTEQVTALMQQQQSAATALLPSSPPKITGAT
jgi:lipopolysaccharide export LptBFGC system permease protein LptF